MQQLHGVVRQVLGEPFTCLVRKVQALKIRISLLKHLHEPQPLNVVVKASMSAHHLIQGILARMPERTVSQVVRKRDRNDARRVNLLLTGTGLRLKNAQLVLEPQRVRLMLKQLTPKQRDDALRGLEVLAKAAQDMMREQKKETSPLG